MGWELKQQPQSRLSASATASSPSATLASLIRAAQECQCILQSPDSSTATAQAAMCLCSHLFTVISRTDHSSRSIQHRLCWSLIWWSQWKKPFWLPWFQHYSDRSAFTSDLSLPRSRGQFPQFCTDSKLQKKLLAHRSQTGKKSKGIRGNAFLLNGEN